MRRVVITGRGTINPLGNSVAQTQAAMAEGRCAIAPVDVRDADRLSIRIAAQVTDYRGEDHFDRAQLALFDPVTQFAVLSAQQAMAEAGLTGDALDLARAGVVLGTAAGGIQTWEDSYRTVFEEGRNRVHPFVVPRLMASAAASHLSMIWGLKGPAFTVSTACASSNHALGLAFQMIRAGGADVMLSGGAEAMVCFGGMKAWEGLRVMAPDACRPFSKGRGGMVLGEGSAVFVLEDLEHARARGAQILGEILGFAMNADANDIVMPSVDGASAAMAAALEDAGLGVGDIGYINAHGTGTAANDRTESAAIAQVFGAAAQDVPVSSTKSMHGHIIGGTGAVELLACLMALNDGVIAPTVGYENPDPDCPLDIVPNTARQARVEATLSNAFAFGGMNAVLALGRAP